MNLNILVAKRKDSDMKPVKFAAGSGQTPEAYAIAMLMCGPGHTVQGYIMCFKNKVNWVHGMSGGNADLHSVEVNSMGHERTLPHTRNMYPKMRTQRCGFIMEY